jgi:maleylacetoacetate isomerase
VRTSPTLRLHTYFRSSAAYRVRIALELKGLDWEPVAWHMVKGEHRSEAYCELASFGLMPMLEIDGLRLQQSLPIIEYLESRFPQVPLLPTDEASKAHARSLAMFVACEIHPLNNLRVLQYLRGPLALQEAQVLTWYRHWCSQGLAHVEAELLSAGSKGDYSLGASPGVVDCFLVPQLFNARRFDVDLSAFPRALAVEQACMALPAFQRAQPSSQADAE